MEQLVDLNKWFCFILSESYRTMVMYLQCTGVVVIDEEDIHQCCFLQKISYKKPGYKILYHLMNTTLQCKKGWSGTNCDACALQWTGDNCDACVPGWAGDDCDACVPGWTGDDCDTCADGWLPPTCDQICDGFGCCNQGECQGCIQNGRWEGLTGSGFPVQVDLTFSGSRCSDLVPGEYYFTVNNYYLMVISINLISTACNICENVMFLHSSVC